MMYRVYFRRRPDDPDAPLDHYDFVTRIDAEEAFTRMFGTVRLEQIRVPSQDDPPNDMKAIA